MKSNETLLIRHFTTEGAGPVPEADIQAMLAPYENRKLNLAQIYEAADKVSNLYRERGYLVAKAYVPAHGRSEGHAADQDHHRQIWKDRRQERVAGSYDYVQGVINHALDGATEIQRKELERAMLLVADLAGGGMPRVAIGSGKQPETSDFVFDVPQGRRVDGYLLYDNSARPMSGATV